VVARAVARAVVRAVAGIGYLEEDLGDLHPFLVVGALALDDDAGPLQEDGGKELLPCEEHFDI